MSTDSQDTETNQQKTTASYTVQEEPLPGTSRTGIGIDPNPSIRNAQSKPVNPQGQQIIRNRDDVRIVETPLFDPPRTSSGPTAVQAQTNQGTGSRSGQANSQQQTLPVKALFPVHTIGSQNRITFRRQFIPSKKSSTAPATIQRQGSNEEEGPTVRQHLQQQLASGSAYVEGIDSGNPEERHSPLKSKFPIYSPKAIRSRASSSLESAGLLGISRENAKGQPLRKAQARKRSAPIFAPTAGTHTVSSVPVDGEPDTVASTSPEKSTSSASESVAATTTQPRTMASHTMTIVQPGFGPREQVIYKINRKLSNSGENSSDQPHSTSIIPRSTNASVQSLPLPLTSIAAAERRANAAQNIGPMSNRSPARMTNGHSVGPGNYNPRGGPREYPVSAAVRNHPTVSSLLSENRNMLEHSEQLGRTQFETGKDESQSEKVQRILANSNRQQRKKQNSRSEETNDEALNHYFDQLSLALSQNSIEPSNMDMHLMKIGNVVVESLMAEGDFEYYEEVATEDHTGELDDDILERLLTGVPKFDLLLDRYYDALPNEIEARAELAKMEVSTSQMVVPPPQKLEKAPPTEGQSQGPNSEHHIPKSEHAEQNLFSADLDLDQYLNFSTEKDPMLTEGVEKRPSTSSAKTEQEEDKESPQADMDLFAWLNQQDEDELDLPDDDEAFSSMFKADGKTLNEYMGDLGDFDAGDLDIGSIGASFEDPTSHGEHHGSRPVPGQEPAHQQHHVEGDENMIKGMEYEEEEEEHKDHMDPEFLTFTALDTPENVQQYLNYQCQMLCDDLNRMPENQKQEHMKLIVSQHEDEIEKSYGKKLQVIKKDMKSLVYANAALVDEISRLSHRVNQCNEERKVLARRLCHHFRNYIRRLQTAKKRKQELERKAAELHLKGEQGTSLDEIRQRLLRQEVKMPQLLPSRMASSNRELMIRDESEKGAIPEEKAKVKKGRKPRTLLQSNRDTMPLAALKALMKKEKERKRSKTKKEEELPSTSKETSATSVETPHKLPSPSKRAVLDSNSPTEEERSLHAETGQEKSNQQKSRLERAAAREALRNASTSGASGASTSPKKDVTEIQKPDDDATTTHPNVKELIRVKISRNEERLSQNEPGLISISRETRSSSRTSAPSETQSIEFDPDHHPTPRKTSERIAKRHGENIEALTPKRTRNEDSDSLINDDFEYQPKVSKARKRVFSSGSQESKFLASVRTRNRQKVPQTSGANSETTSGGDALEMLRMEVESEIQSGLEDSIEVEQTSSHLQAQREEYEVDKKKDKSRRVSQRELLTIHTEEIITVGDSEADNSSKRLTRSKRNTRSGANPNPQQQSPRESLARTAKRKT
ncbi:hypothetical protein WR25_01516 [Diploscapter pachys]|uniref:Uncharacterized protein n=1 Tax=Diploscapter pachys TaxID=2018661 RepID=A0A2A2J183_9BILA|nr:hypothetical protein WR25_01516 [Diploscapter pachys]